VHGRTTVNRGDVWAVDLNPATGSEMDKIRPCLVITNDIANKYSRVIVVVALTSAVPKKPYPWMVEVPETANMPLQSWVHCARIHAVDRARLGRFYTSLDSDTMRKVDEALIEQLGINAALQMYWTLTP
jgi:mRNA interferase MazF